MKAEQLKRLRDDLGLTQIELAEKLKVDRITVVRWENETIDIPYAVELALKQIKVDEAS